jgi:hypothetical protein
VVQDEIHLKLQTRVEHEHNFFHKIPVKKVEYTLIIWRNQFAPTWVHFTEVKLKQYRYLVVIGSSMHRSQLSMMDVLGLKMDSFVPAQTHL